VAAIPPAGGLIPRPRYGVRRAAALGILAVVVGAVVIALRIGQGAGVAQVPPPVTPGGPVLRPPIVDPGTAVGPEEVRWPTAPSRALGKPFHGSLVRGVQLPAFGEDYVTWDPALKQVPDRDWRRWGTDRLVRTLLRVLHEYRATHPDAMPAVVGDLSRPHGGPFGARYGGHGHASHQNGLDVDVYYPRADRRLRAALSAHQIDRSLSQDLVDRFVAAGAQYVFVGRHTALRGPRRIVQTLVLHDDHMHVRLRRG
jgi:murein endopeptidase